MSATPGAGETDRREGLSMLALIQSHLYVHRIDAETLFRAAYQRRFEKDCVLAFIREDVDAFKRTGNAPPYVIDYMLHIVSRR